MVFIFFPFLAGMILACTCLLAIQEFLLGEVGFSYLILARFLQDCQENLFSLIRFRQAIPNALVFKENLKVITLAQLCLTSRKTSYFVDCEDSEIHKLQTDFLELCKRLRASKKGDEDGLALMEASAVSVPRVQDSHLSSIDDWECAVFYDLAGAVLRSLKRINVKLCATCTSAVLWRGEGHHPCAIAVQLRNYKVTSSTLVGVSDDCFRAIVKTEITFREMRNVLASVEHFDILEFMVSNLMYVWEGTTIPACYIITRKILERYLTMRYKMYGLLRRQQLAQGKTGEFSSKSMAMRAAVSR